MAAITITELVDDIDGGAADETVEFALDGATMAIDLSARNADRLRGILAEFVEKGRRVGGRIKHGKSGALARAKAAPKSAPEPSRETAPKTAPTSPVRAANGTTSTNGASRPKPPTTTFLEPSPADIRAWAKGQKIRVNPRGRIPESVKAMFMAASRGADAKRS